MFTVPPVLLVSYKSLPLSSLNLLSGVSIAVNGIRSVMGFGELGNKFTKELEVLSHSISDDNKGKISTPFSDS